VKEKEISADQFIERIKSADKWIVTIGNGPRFWLYVIRKKKESLYLSPMFGSMSREEYDKFVNDLQNLGTSENFVL
jgi:hypothetical protein